MRRLVGLTGALLLTGALAGCSSTVDSDDLTEQVGSAVSEAAGEDPSATDCPELDAEEGATATCTVTVADEAHDVDVEVTSVGDDSAEFDITVPEELRATPAVAADELAQQVSDTLTEEVGQEPESVTCPEDLPGEVGARTTCVLTASDGTELETKVQVTSVEDGQVDFSIEVAPEPTG